MSLSCVEDSYWGGEHRAMRPEILLLSSLRDDSFIVPRQVYALRTTLLCLMLTSALMERRTFILDQQLACIAPTRPATNRELV